MDIIKSNIVSLHGAVVSKQGGRPENQDNYAFLDTPLGFLLVVCDGMGGGPGGKTASYIAKYEICSTLLECNPQTPREHALKMAIARAHEAMEEKMKEVPALNGMGSTVVAILVDKQSAIIAHAGDSRCYRFQGKKCLYRSNDHSLVAELVKKKVMTEEEARKSPQSNVITRGLGNTKNQVPEIEEIPYKKGDRFVLCTDGVWGIMPHEELLKNLSARSDIQTIVSNMSAKVDEIGFQQGGHHDNHTLAMFEMEIPSVLKSKYSWKRWGIFGLAGCMAVVTLVLCIWGIVHLIGLTDKKDQTVIYENQPATVAYKPSSSSKTNEETSAYSVTEEMQSSDNEEQVADSSNIEIKGLLNSIKQNIAEAKTKIATEAKKDSAKTATDANKGKQEKPASKVSVETVQKIINRYDNAKIIAEPSIDEAKKKLEELKKEIGTLWKEVSEKQSNNDIQTIVAAIDRVMSGNECWYVDKEPDAKTKKYGLTTSSKSKIDKLIKRLKGLKEYLSK